MPSEPRSDPMLIAALAAVAPSFEAWRSAVAASAEEVRGMLGRRGSPVGVGSALGAFAAGRVDLDRFAGLVERRESLDGAALDALRRAADVLGKAAAAPAAEQVIVRVPDGGRMRDVLFAALDRLGRAFGASRVAALVEQGRLRPDADVARLEGLAARVWTRRERRVTPPLVVDVSGADLDAAALVEVLDGGAKVVLLVRGPATPAPLVRLVTPGTFVLQTSDATGLDAFAKAVGPAVAAILPEDAAAFVHDPAGGPSLLARLVVRRPAKSGPRSPVGPWSAAQQAEEIAQLAALAERPDAAAGSARSATPPAGSAAESPVGAARPAAAASGEPADRLAAWLLSAVDLRDVR